MTRRSNSTARSCRAVQRRLTEMVKVMGLGSSGLVGDGPLLLIPAAVTACRAFDTDANVATAPCLRFSSRMLELGAMPPGASTEAEWWIENGGGKRLMLVERRAGCCGEAALGRHFEVAP